MSLTISLKAFSLSGFTFVGGTAVLPANSRTHVGVRVSDKVVVQTPAATNVDRSVIWLATCTTSATDVTLCIEHDPLMQLELAELAPISGADYLSFNQSPSGVPETPGTLYWDSEELCFAFRGKSTGTVCQIGRELWARVRNNSDVDIPDGAAVVVTGAIGGYPTVRLATALTDTHLDTLGVTTEAIAKNAFGEVTTAGDVNGLAIPSGWAEGDTLYLSNSPGVLTNTPPGDPSFAVSMGLVLRAHATNGRISVRVQNATDPIVALDPDNLGQVDLSGTETIGLKHNGNWAATTVDKLADYLGAVALGTYSHLRNYGGSATRVYIAGAGIAGVFILDDTDTTSADNGGTVIVDADGRRWKRNFEGAVSVKWFGAVGDGATDDTAAIQAAIDNLSGFSWKGTTRSTEINCKAVTLFFPKGVYRITSKIRLSPGLRFVGNGHGNFLQEAGGSSQLNTALKVEINNYGTYAFDTSPFNASGVRVDDALLRGEDSSNGVYTFAEAVEFHNIHIIGNNTCKCLNLAGVPLVRINNVYISNFVIGVRLSASWGGQYNNLRMTYISWKAIIHWYEVTALTMSNVYITGMLGGTVYSPAVSGYDGSEATPYDSWTQEDNNTKTCGIYTFFGGYTGHGVTVEGFQVAFSGYSTCSSVYGVYVEGITARIIQTAGGTYGNQYFDFFKVAVSPTANFIWSQYAKLHVRVRSEGSAGATTAADFNKLIELVSTLDNPEFYPVVDGLTLKAGDPISTVGAFSLRSTEHYQYSGSFTPVVRGADTPGVGTYTAQVGVYARIGNRVDFNINVKWTAHTGAGVLQVAGLPFASANTGTSTPVSISWIGNLGYSANSAPMTFIPSHTTWINFAQSVAGVFSFISISSAGEIYIQGTYFV